MPVTYVGTCPYDPELELKNFRQKQVEYEAAWCATSDPQVLHEAFLNARGYLQFPPELGWLGTALGNFIAKSRAKGKRTGKPSRMVERQQDRMRHIQRYRCIRNLCKKGYTEERALDLATEQLAAARLTIKDSYDKVRKSLEQKGHESEYSRLIARSDPTPTVVPVSVTQTAAGVTVINGQGQRIVSEVTRGPWVTE